MDRRTKLVVASMSVAMLPITGSVAAAQPPESDAGIHSADVPPGAVLQTDGTYLLLSEVTLEVEDHEVTPAQLVDTEGFSETRGVPLELALKDYLWQEEFGKITTLIEDSHPEGYTAARRTELMGSPFIMFRDEVPEVAHQAVAGASRHIELIGNQGYSQKEGVEVLVDSFEDVRAHPEVQLASGSFDETTGKIEVRVNPEGTETTVAEWESLRTEIQPAAPRNPALQIDVALDQSIEPMQQHESQGGGYFRVAPNDSSYPCTTGFTVRHRGGVKDDGLATAGHCVNRPGGNTRWYNDHNLSQWRSHSAEEWVDGSQGDIGWYSANIATPVAVFYSNWGVSRSQQGQRNPQVNDSLYVFGTTSGRDSGVVVETNACHVHWCHLTRVSGADLGTGDSGGPWYLGNYGYGVTVGQSGGDVYFTPLGRLTTLFGMNIKTW